MKLRFKLLGFLAVGFMLLVSSCANESPFGSESRADGKIFLNLEADSNVSCGTRADDVSPYVPNVAEFTIKLRSTDGTYSNSWKSIDAFNAEEGFPMGSYIISATFGNMDQEGFVAPFFYGESKVNVTKGEESNVNITATLANTMLSIRYNDEFSKFFKGYSATSNTQGHDPVVFVQTENRPAYISTGDVEIKLTLTNNADQTVTISPTTFKAEPQKHYILTFGVDGNTNVADAVLSIEWSEEVETVDEVIPLDEELFTSPAPVGSLEGFEDAPEVIFEGLDYESINPEFHVMTLGGLKEATLTLKSDDTESVQTFSLVGADMNTQATLKGYGIDCAGLFEESGKFGVVNLKEYVKGLLAGNYTATLDVKDSYSRSLETPVEFKVSITDLEYGFLSYEKPDFMADELVVYVQTNCPDLKDNLNFKAWGSDDNFANVAKAEYVDDSKPAGVEASMANVYKYKLTLSHPVNNWEWKVQVQGGKKNAHESQILVNMPEFTVETDAFAHKVRFRLKPGTDENILDKILQYGAVYNGTQKVEADLSKIYKEGIFTLEGLEASHNYTYTLNLGRTIYTGEKGYQNNVSFKTEDVLEVPNGGFEDLTEKYRDRKVNQGGDYGTSNGDLATYTNYSTYTIKEADKWATTNLKTIDGGTNNTWHSQPSVFNSSLSYRAFCDFRKDYQIPSSYSGYEGHNGSKNAMIVRNVAWSPNGVVPDKNGEGTGLWGIKKTNEYYNFTIPNITNVSVGKMFLGDYSYSGGTEHYSEGIEFNSRPTKLKGYYIFTPDPGDTSDYGVVEVKLYNEDTLVASGQKELTACVNYVEFTIPLTYQTFGLKANKLMIMVSSSKYGSKKMEEETREQIATSKYHTMYESYFHGATLVVDDFSFEY